MCDKILGCDFWSTALPGLITEGLFSVTNYHQSLHNKRLKFFQFLREVVYILKCGQRIFSSFILWEVILLKPGIVWTHEVHRVSSNHSEFQQNLPRAVVECGRNMKQDEEKWHLTWVNNLFGQTGVMEKWVKPNQPMISCQHGIGLRAGAVSNTAGAEAPIVCKTDSTQTPFTAHTIQEEGACPQAISETAAAAEAEAAATFIIQACFCYPLQKYW